MPLDTAGLKTALVALFTANLSEPNTTQIDQINTMCGGIADAMTTFVQTAEVIYDDLGLVAPSGGGPVTGVSGMTLE